MIMLISHVIADNDAALLFCRQWHHKNAKDAMAIREQIHMYVYVCVEKDHRMEGMKRKCVASASAAISQRKYQMGGVSCHRIHSHYPLSTLFPLSATYACIHTYIYTHMILVAAQTFQDHYSTKRCGDLQKFQ